MFLLLSSIFFQPEIAAQLKEAIRIQTEQRLIQQQQKILEHQPFVQDGQVCNFPHSPLSAATMMNNLCAFCDFPAAVSAQLRSVLQSHSAENRQNHRAARSKKRPLQGANCVQHVQGSGHLQSAQQFHFRGAQSVSPSWLLYRILNQIPDNNGTIIKYIT